LFKTLDFLNKLRNQPEHIKKIILWATVVIIGLIMLVLWWFFIFQKTIKSFNSEKLKENFNIQGLEDQIQNLQKVELPKISEEDAKKIEEELKKMEEQGKTATGE